MSNFSLQNQQFLFGILFVVLLIVGFAGYRFYLLIEERDELIAERDTLLGNIGELEATLQQTNENLEESQANTEFLSEALQNEQQKLSAVEDTVEEVTGIVGDLQKLESIDSELLQKYSKVYFLNEHYEPADLVDIETEYLYIEEEPEQIDARVWPFLEELLEDAHDDDIPLFIASGYRSFGEQGEIKSGYSVTYGSGANTFSADQGYSEHQLGTTVDFISTGIDGTLQGFDNTEAYEWLVDNAHEYGFTLSYPEVNSYYIFEPWHWRFVGTDLAAFLNDEDVHLYDLTQWTIDEYRLELFD